MPFGMELMIGFVVMWLVLFLALVPVAVGHLGGWSKLGAEYRLNGQFDGPRWWFQDVMLRGWCGYNGCVSVGANAEGLYLNTIFLISHPPLFIPWTDLTVSRRDVRFLGFRLGMVEFVAARVPSVRLALKESLLKRIAASRAARGSAVAADSSVATSRDAMHEQELTSGSRDLK